MELYVLDMRNSLKDMGFLVKEGWEIVEYKYDCVILGKKEE